LHIPTLLSEHVHPCSQKMFPHDGSTHKVAWICSGAQRQAPPAAVWTQAHPAGHVFPSHVPADPWKAPASSAQSGPPSCADASAPSVRKQLPVTQTASHWIDPQLGTAQAEPASDIPAALQKQAIR
jgi:hypothetical protein